LEVLEAKDLGLPGTYSVQIVFPEFKDEYTKESEKTPPKWGDKFIYRGVTPKEKFFCKVLRTTITSQDVVAEKEICFEDLEEKKGDLVSETWISLYRSNSTRESEYGAKLLLKLTWTENEALKTKREEKQKSDRKSLVKLLRDAKVKRDGIKKKAEREKKLEALRALQGEVKLQEEKADKLYEAGKALMRESKWEEARSKLQEYQDYIQANASHKSPEEDSSLIYMAQCYRKINPPETSSELYITDSNPYNRKYYAFVKAKQIKRFPMLPDFLQTYLKSKGITVPKPDP
jgi:hypothetical protein